jgi:ubiquinone biosynthesis accessory factor UbiJ
MSATPPLMCAALEIALNRYLALEPDVLAELARLKDRAIALHAQGPNWEFFVVPTARGVTVLDAWDRKPDVRISTPPTALLRRAFGGAEAGVPGVQVEGDADLLQRFGTIVAKVGFDPEEWLARWVGGGAAHRINEGLRSVLGWGRKSAGTLALDTAEYLREETGDLPHRTDVERWMAEVESLRQRSDGLAARLDRFERGAGRR